MSGSITFSADEQARYSRQVMLPEVGAAGQDRLKHARVLCIGAGGLGSPAALYLAAAGVGRLGLIDADRVELSNLHRQLLHGTDDVGRPKIESARDRLHAANPHVDVQLHGEMFRAEIAASLVSAYDLVIDGSDNFPTRYLSNDVCVWAKKPNIYGSVFRFDGQASVFAPHLGGPCYRCIFPEPPPPGAAPSCAEAGVFGVLPGIVGLLQATEAIKILVGMGDSLVGRLVTFDALKMTFREFKLRRDPECSVCGENPTIREPIDYERFCNPAPASAASPTISVGELKRRVDAGEPFTLLDVREPFEFELARIPGATLIPLGELRERHREIAPRGDLIVQCHSGVRSARAVEFLRAAGFTDVFNLEGGIDAWSAEIDPTVPRY